jgi:hypothetical protein
LPAVVQVEKLAMVGEDADDTEVEFESWGDPTDIVVIVVAGV